MKQQLKSSITALTIFLIPLIFLPITHEFYNTNKVMLLIVSSLVLLSISVIQFIGTKKIEWSSNALSSLRPILTFLMIITVTTLFRSSNVVQSALDPITGFTTLIALTIFYWYIAREGNRKTKTTHRMLFTFGGLILSLVTVFLSLHPFQNVSLPQTFAFLKNPQFTPLGNQRDLAVFLGFIITYQVFTLIENMKERRKTDWLSLATGLITVVAFGGVLFSLFTTSDASTAQSAPIGLSIKAAISTLSSPLGFLFGSGGGSFSAAFTQVKDSLYNQSPLWQVNSFGFASSAFLQIVVESGALGILSLIWIFVAGFRIATKHPSHQRMTSLFLLSYVAVAFVATPLSFILLFILYITLGFIVSENADKQTVESRSVPKQSYNVVVPLITLVSVTSVVIIGYGLLRMYRAEIAMRNSIDAVVLNDLNKLYVEQRKAVILNPFIERYRLNFSQTNLFIAKQLAAQPNPDQALITKSVQAAINEAQAAIALNPKKASHWENLAIVYKNVLGIKDTDKWAISAYQRAILLDPQNISYRLGLGGVYYSIGQYENAIKLFNDVTLMNPDLPNAYYNLAYAYYENNNPKKAVEIMDILLPLLQRQASPDYKKVQKERNDFLANPPREKAPSVIQ